MSAFRLHNPDCVFIHIPKTGGASIRRGVFGGDYDGPAFDTFPDEWRGLFTFTFVRHPLDRLCSAFRMFNGERRRKSQPKRRIARRSRPKLTFAEFWDIVRDDSYGHDGRSHRRETVIRHHTIPQTHPSNMLDEAEFIGRFERFKTDWKQVADRLGVKTPIPHMNMTIRKHWHDTIPAELIPEIVAWYAADFDRLGYERPEAQGQQQQETTNGTN